MSTKSTALASSNVAQQLMRVEFAKFNLDLRFGDYVRDLGTVTTLTKRRATCKVKLRRGIAFRRGMKLRYLAQ
eukprot:7561817-Pyramimonas_sp.AAC.1